MKFDVIVGNPPYQLGDGGGGGGSSAMPIYNLFIEQAKKLHPRYIAMIIPSRWFVGGKGLDSFRDTMLKDRHIKELVDYPNSSDCFPGVSITGGVCYFIRDEKYDGECKVITRNNDEVLTESVRYLNAGDAGVFIRYPEMISILEKVRAKNEKTMDSIVSSRRPYGLGSDIIKKSKKDKSYNVYDNESDFHCEPIKLYGLDGNKRVVKYMPSTNVFSAGRESVRKYKVFIPKAYGCGAIGETIPTLVLGTPLIGDSPSVCTETFLRIGSFDSVDEAENLLSYLKTKFFRLLVGIKKSTQNTTKDTYSLVPIVDFHKRWIDEELYLKYNLDENEISFIEKMVEEMK